MGARHGVLSRASTGSVSRWTFGTDGHGVGYRNPHLAPLTDAEARAEAAKAQATAAAKGGVVQGMWEYLNATDKRVRRRSLLFLCSLTQAQASFTGPSLFAVFSFLHRALAQGAFGPQEACCHGAIVGFDLSKEPARKVLATWLDCALHRECIAPVGSHRGNHRQDQAALTLLVLLGKERFGAELTCHDFGHLPTSPTTSGVPADMLLMRSAEYEQHWPDLAGRYDACQAMRPRPADAATGGALAGAASTEAAQSAAASGARGMNAAPPHAPALRHTGSGGG